MGYNPAQYFRYFDEITIFEDHLIFVEDCIFDHKNRLLARRTHITGNEDGK